MHTTEGQGVRHLPAARNCLEVLRDKSGGRVLRPKGHRRPLPALKPDRSFQPSCVVPPVPKMLRACDASREADHQSPRPNPVGLRPLLRFEFGGPANEFAPEPMALGRGGFPRGGGKPRQLTSTSRSSGSGDRGGG